MADSDGGQFLFAATAVGPYVYDLYEEGWFDLAGVSAPDQTYWTVDYISEINTARFGTYGRGIWDFVLNNNYDINYGDVNQDNIINIQDIIIIVGFILNTNIPTNEELIVSDINEDQLINILDILLIVDIIFD